VTGTVEAQTSAVLIRAGDPAADTHLPEALPIVLLRPFAAVTGGLADGRSPTIDIPMPLTRDSIERLVQGLSEGGLAELTTGSFEAPASTVPDLRHLKVLAVDDVAVNREVLGEALRSFQIECDLADSGPSALSRVKAKAYDVIFMDVSMPDMDGFQAARLVRDQEQREEQGPAQIVALTGHVMGKEGGEWKEAGMDAYLTKPFNISQLTELFRSLGVSVQTSEVAAVSRSADIAPTDALLSAETLDMFDSIKAATGTDLKAKVFRMFRDNTLAAFDAAVADIAAADPDAVRLVHALKSNCSSAGAARAMRLCQEMETALSEGRVVNQAALDELRLAIVATAEAMAALQEAA
jgi:two-component system sensor histidine kinase BarA